MLKKILGFILSLISLVEVGCAQNQSGRLTIDKNIKHDLFDFLPYGATFGPSKIYIDSQLVYTDTTDSEIQSMDFNADIIDIKKRHLGFNVCRSFFLRDTLKIEFTSTMSVLTDKMTIKIKDKRCWAFMASGDSSRVIPGEMKFLTFKEEIKKTGQEIFGETFIYFRDPESQETFVMYGPFRCIVE